ncbi:hypothetical protein DPSP01_013463 [Paraphaeosphaeria sporulosa]|uniref:Uncharacterized protein n=1 Tax=Paraphaeosphaeria sporulosa TaxID=1460663 RepID=A0A177C0N2_9PLEO|nr:uncharacterized protein CC84DRAFT_1128814 [Paraphaeosphaeria sporulosa]OAG00267.1 hypothetical protein CC84DRAFT_1128814 [Paraphaeosphaeria sporulosa]
MAALKGDADRAPASKAAGSPLARALRDFEALVQRFETRLLRARDVDGRDDEVRREACTLALAELGARHTKLEIRRSLSAAEAQGRRVEQLLHAARDGHDAAAHDDDDLRAIHHGYFRLYSTELFDLLGQPVDLRLGTVRFHHCDPSPPPTSRAPDQGPVSLELALGSSFFVADALETLPFHAFKVPRTPSLQNRGILSRKPADHGAFPPYDSWLLFTFLGHGCLKLEVPIEMCADVYGAPLAGRENEEVHFWGVFVDDDAP